MNATVRNLPLLISIAIGMSVVIYFVCLCVDMEYDIGNDDKIFSLEYSEALHLQRILLGVGALYSAICLINGIRHKRKNTIVTNGALLVVYFSIVVFFISCYQYVKGIY